MSLVVGDLLLLVSDLGTIAFAAIALGQVLRFVPHPHFQQIIFGMLFALAAIFSILNHSYVPHTLPSDPGAIYLGFVAAFIGWRAAIITLAITLLFKANQGSLLDPLTLGIPVLAMLAGSAWRWGMPRHGQANVPALLAFAALVTVATLPAMLIAFWETKTLTLIDIGLSLGFNLVLAVALGSLVQRERVLIVGEQQLRHEANTDELTGLQNRRTLAASFEAGNFGSRIGRSVMLVDIDNFKSINDAHGHAAGDQVLRHVALVMQQALRNGDLLVRYGGEEFAVLLLANSEEEALAAGERLRNSIERTRVSIGQLSIALTISVGLTWWIGKTTMHVQLEGADAALYQAKRNGRNQVIAFNFPTAASTEKNEQIQMFKKFEASPNL